LVEPLPSADPSAALAATGDIEDLVRLGKAVGDQLRARILQVLNQDSYSVGELCQLFDVPQPALSHHLKILLQAGLLARRREGNSLFYRRASQPDNAAVAVLFEQLDQASVDEDLAARIHGIHHDRNRRSAEFFASNATEISAQQAQICEPATYADLVIDMIQNALADGLSNRHALEVGPGGGMLLARMGELFETATGVDNSRSMLNVARAALKDGGAIHLRHQDFMALPAHKRYDAILAAMVVHHQASPASFFNHAARVLHRPGALVVVELCHHDQEWAAHACGDQWLGFEPQDLETWARHAGFTTIESQYLAQKNGFRVQIHRFAIPGRRDNRTSTIGPTK